MILITRAINANKMNPTNVRYILNANNKMTLLNNSIDTIHENTVQ